MRISRFSDRTDTVYHFLIAFLVYLIGGLPILAYALPQGGTIASGTGSIDTSGSSLTVTQTTNKIIINWESFSIGNNESVIFVQPESSASALNNILGSSRTVVEGNLTANGQIVLSNPNGIFISPEANVNVASLIASTLKISEQDFLDGLYKFSQDPSKPLASILNEGKIRASDFAALIAPSVENKGVVIANLGTVGLVSGEAATIDFVGDNLIKFTVNEAVEGQVLDKDGNLISDRISNSGSIQADGGQVILSAKNASSIIQNVINMSGVIEAKTVTEKNGRIFLGGGDQGTVKVAGTLNASGEESGEQGGEITVEGADVIVAEGSILAKGTNAKGGTITIAGTDWVNAGGTMDVSGETGGDVNITTGGLSIAAPILAKGTTGDGGNININTLFKSWEIVSAMLDVSGASGGTIKHFADQTITTSGKYLALGTDGKGGSIDVTANGLRFLSNTIDASGTTGGGSIRLGGEYQGGKNLPTDEIKNANFLFMNDGVNITAKTTGSDGAGGRVIAWADQKAFVIGQFDTRPGTQTGAGGFVEVSSGDTLTFGGHVKTGIDERTGTLLLDPKNITIADTKVYSDSPYMIGQSFSGGKNVDETDESYDEYGVSVALDGQWLVVGNPKAQESVCSLDCGAALLYSFTDTAFSGGKLEAIIGEDNTGGKNFDLEDGQNQRRDYFGISVSIIGGRLAVGARGDDGANEFESNNGYMLGTVYLFNLVDSSGNVTSDPSAFSEIRMQGRIGNYNGAEYKSITAFADGGTGVTTITSRSHRRTAGDSITIADTTNYDGTFTISSIVDDNTFTISTAFVANDATGNMRIDNVFPNDINLGSTYDPTGTGPAANRTGESEALGGIQNSDMGKNDGDGGYIVSLSEGADGSTRLALGMVQNDGAGEWRDQQDEGAVLLFTFNDATNKDFSSGQLAAVIGEDFDNNYSGANPRSGKDLAISLDEGDYFGYSVDLDYDPVLNRHRLAVVAPRDDGVAGSNTNHGRVYLFTFTDDSFSGAAHTASVCADCAAQIGGKHLTKLLVDSTGDEPNFNGVALDGNYLAIASYEADGNGGDDTGDVYIYSFSHLSGDEFANGTLEGSVGYNFTGGTTEGTRDIAVVPESGEELRANDYFGSGIALYNNRLVAGAYGADGSGDSHSGAGDIHIFDISHYDVGDGSDFDNSTTASQINNATSSDDITIWPSSIENILSGGSNVTLQANNDITVNAAITAANGSGDGGDLTMQAGRSILINANITTDNGDLTLTANETAANGVVDAQRDSGAAAITMNSSGSGTTINTGTGTFTATISAGADKTNSGTADITLDHVTAGALVVANNGTTADSDILGNVGGVLTIAGTSSFTTAASDGVITLDSANALTGVVTLNTNSSGSSANATLDNGTTALDIAASTIGGTLTLTSGHASGIIDSGLVTVGGNFSATTDDNNGVINVGSMAVDGTVALTTNGNGAATIVNDAGLNFAASTVRGALSATATTGDITDSGDLTITGASTFITGATGSNIVLDSSSNAFSNSVEMRADAGGEAFGNITFVDSADIDFATSASSNGDLFINSSTDGTVGGNLSVTATTGNITDTVALAISGTSSFTTSASNATISLGTATNSFVEAVSFTTAGTTGDVALTTGTTALILGTSTVNGDLAVIAGAAVTQSGALTILGTTTVSASGNDVTLNLATNNFDSNNSGDRDVTITGKDVSIRDTDHIALGRQTISGNLTVQAGGNIDDGNILTVAGTTTMTGGGYVKFNHNGGSDYTGPVNVNAGGEIVLKDTNSIELGTITGTGNLTVTASTSTTGTVTQSGIIDVDGLTTINNSGGDVTLNNVDNDFGNGSGVNAVKVIGANVSIKNSDILELGASTVSGTYAATAVTGNITDSGTLAITGLATFTTSASNATITLDETGSTFAAGVSLNTTGSSGNATVDTGTNALDIAASTIGGNLALTAGNHITDSGVITVGGTSSFTADVNDKTITLTEAHVLTGAISITTTDDEATTSNDADVSITGINSGLELKLGTLNIKGDFSIATSNTVGISDEGVLTIHGTSTFVTSADNATIILDSANLFSGGTNGTVDLSTQGTSGHVTLNVGASTDLRFAASEVRGNLTVTTGSGSAVAQRGILTVDGTTDITANNGASNISLNSYENVLTGAISLKGHNSRVINSKAVELGTVDAAAMVVTARGAITQSGVVDSNGQSTLTAQSSDTNTDYDITLENTSNNFGGNLIVTAANVSIKDTGTTTIAGTDVSGNYALTTTGGVTDNGDIDIEGTTTISASGSNIILDRTGNDFTGAVAVVGANVELTDANAIVLGTADVSGTYEVRSVAGDITDSGTLTIAGASTFITDATGSNIILDSSSNAFSGSVEMNAGDDGAGNEAFGNITFVDSAGVDFATAANNNGDLFINGSTDGAVGGNLSVTATQGNITDTVALTVSGTTTLTTSANGALITLNNSSNGFTGAMTITTNDDSGNDAHVTIDGGTTALQIALSTIDGDLTLTSGNASGITDTDWVTVGGNFSATTNANSGVITLDNLAVDGTFTLAPDSNGAVTIVNDDGLTLAASTMGGTFSGTATIGNITDTGALAITGTTTLVTSANDATITLDTETNAFTGAVTITTNDDSGADADVTIDGGTTELVIATSTVDGDLTLKSGHANGVTDSGTVTVGGNLSLTNDVDNGNVNMDTLAVTGTIALTTQGGSGNATVVNASAIDFATSTSGGQINATARGPITQSGVITTGAQSTWWARSTGGTDYDITLENTSNNFVEKLIIRAANVSIKDTGTTKIGATIVSGNYALTTTGEVTDSGNMNIEGTTTISSSGSNIILDRSGNDFTGAVAVVGANVQLVDANAIVLGTSDVSGTYQVTATAGNITDTGALTVAGTSTLETTANDASITLDQGGHAFTGALLITTNDTGTDTLGDVTIYAGSGAALDFGASTIDGDLIARSGHATGITDSGVVTVRGTSSYQTTATDADISLGTSTLGDGNGTDTITLNTTGSGGNATLDNGTTAIVLGTSAASLTTSVGGDLTLQTGHASGITDSGTVTVSRNLSATTDDNNGVINLGTLVVDGTITLATNDDANDDSAHATIVNTCSVCSYGLKFATSTVEGNLSATATTGNITQEGALTVRGTTTLVTSAQAATIDLSTITTNEFTGELLITTNDNDSPADGEYVADVTIDGGTTNLIIGTSTIDGALNLLSGGTITDTNSSTVTVLKNLSATTDASNSAITLDGLAVTGSIGLTTHGNGNAAVVNASALDLAASTIGGTLGATASAGDITDSGQLMVTGAATFTAANNQSIYLDNHDASNTLFGIHTFSSTVSFSSGGTLANVTIRDSGAFDFGAALALATGGDLIVTAGGDVTQTGGALTVPGTTTVNAAGNTVTLSNSSNNFTGAVSINALTVDLEDTNAIVLGASTVTGNYAVEAGSAITQSAALAITGVTTLEAGAGNNITLDNASNNFLNAVKITSGNNVTLVDADTIDLGASTVSGTYAVTAKLGNITQSGNLTVTNASTFETEATNGTILCGNLLCTSTGGTNAFSGTVKLTTTGSSGHAYIDNGTTALEIANDTSVGGNLTLVSGHASGITDAGTLTVGGNLYATTDANNGVINLGGLDMSATTSKIQLTTHNNGAATVVNTKHLHFISADVGGNFSATATDGTIIQDSAFDIDGTSDFHSVSADNIILDSAANDFTGDVRFRGGAVVIKDTNDIEFGGGDSTAAGTLADSNGNQYALKIYAGDRITDDNTIPSNLKITGGNAWFGTNNNSADRIVLDSASNVFSGTLTMEGGIGHTVNSSAAVVLTAMTLAGDLRVTTTGGTVTDTGVLSVEGLTVISASGFDVTLDGDGTTYNNFQDEVQIVGANVVIKDTNNIELGKSTVSGTYDVTAGGTVTQNQLTANPLDITGVSTITGTDITLNNTANNFIAAIGVNTIGSDVVLVDTNAIVLGASTVSGTYSVTAGGAVTQAASTVLDIEGVTTIEAGSNVVTLTNANDFTSAVGVTGTTVQVTDTNDLDLGATTTTGAYTVIAGGGITDSGALTIGTTASAQTASFTAGNGRAIILDQVDASSNPVHDFSGALTFAASSGNLAGLTVYAVDAINLAALTLVAAGGGDLAGNLSLKSGTVTQAGAWVVPGTTTVSSIGSDVTLGNTSNDFGGAVSVTGVDVTLVDANAIDLGASTVTGNYAVTATAGGGITDSGVLNVTGTSTFTAAGGQSIILDESSTFTSAVTFASGGTLAGVSITDSTDFDLQALSISGNLAVESGGSITQSGSLAVGGTSSFTTSSTNETIMLSDASSTNAFTGAFTLSSTGANAHVTIDNGTTAIDIASASVGGNLTLTSGAAAGITDSGPVTVAGNLIAITDANNGVIDMGTLAVDGSISLTTHGIGDATIVNDAGLNFASSTIGGDLNATATTLNIIDSGTITVTGATIITLGTNPILSVSGATTATDIDDFTITLDTANNLFTGGITLRYDNILPDNSDIDLARQVVFAELLWGLHENRKSIYGAYEDINENDNRRMYELFLKSLPKSKKEYKEVNKHLSNEFIIKKINTVVTEEDGNKEL